ncbi:MAG TPA: alanine racemase [bacterium]|nr:alanine racemase [bacterium]HPR87011.1 alanine racemase [bacterium]
MNPEHHFFRPAWVEVDLDAIAANYRQIHAALGRVQLCAVVKADAYGGGAVMVARHLETLGVARMAVVSLDEAAELRRAGIRSPLLNMGPVFPHQAEAVLDLELEQMVFQPEVLEALAQAAQRSGRKARIHLKVDTGMSRYGLSLAEAGALLGRLAAWPGLDCCGVMTHFPISDGLDKSFALLQIAGFTALHDAAEAQGIRIPLWHMCNSGGVLDLPQAHFDMVRVGLMLHGYYPSREVRRPFTLQPAMQVKCRIAAVRTLGRGDTVGYGRRWMAEKPERIAVLPIGYADGYDRKLRNIGEVLLAGRRAPIVGGLCMDACFIRVTEIPEAQVGMDVTIMGREGEQEISPHDIAARIDSVSYEVMARWGRRLPRLYRRDGTVVAVRHDLGTSILSI